MLVEKFEKFLSFLKDKKIVITSHELVDLDGLSSCYALEYFLNTFFKTQQKAIYFSEISKFTKSFILNYSERFPDINFSFQTKVDFSKYDVCLILDTNNIDQIKFKNEIKSSKIPFLFIDHHYKQNVIKEGNIPSLNLLFEDYSSTTEIILQFFNIFNVSLSLPLKVLMTAAILTDSGFFKYGDNQTLRNVTKLLDDELDFQDIRSLLKNHEDLSEKIAKIKGMQRVELYREGDYLIGITNVSSYGARVASMLLQVGFDIGIVNSKEKETIRINTRAKKAVCLKTGLHLGKILDKIAEDYEGSGGGHDGAASLTCNVETRIIINEILVNVKPYLQSKF